MSQRELQLEIERLADDLIDGKISAADAARFRQLLAHSEDARKHYVHVMHWNAAATEISALQTPLHDDSFVAKSAIRSRGHLWPQAARSPRATWMVAACLLLALGATILATSWPGDQRVAVSSNRSGVDQIFVATATSQPGPGRSNHVVQSLASRQSYGIQSGSANIEFACGARIHLLGPADVLIGSAWEVSLQSGMAVVTVPSKAVGFRLKTDESEVLDLGTQFVVRRDSRKALTSVKVLEGKVQVSSDAAPMSRPRTLLVDEVQEVGRSGLVPPERTANPQAFSFAEKLIERPVVPRRPMDTVQWTFDADPEFPVDDTRYLDELLMSDGDTPSLIQLYDTTSLRPGFVFAARQSGRSLRFDGAVLGEAEIPELASALECEVSFWVSTPGIEAVPPAGAIVSFHAVHPRFQDERLVPIRIALCRVQSRGPLGSVEVGIGDSVTTASRVVSDGKWHHVVVRIQKNESLHNGWQALVEVDGRLDTITSLVSGVPLLPADEDDTPQLGRLRLGGDGISNRMRFVGEVDDVKVMLPKPEP